MGKMTEANGLPGWLSEPSDGAVGSVIVLQEWWGLNDQIKGVGDRLAASGFRAFVPDLYRGKVADTEDEAKHLMDNLRWDQAVADVQTAADWLEQPVAVMGFCMGGALTLLSAVQVTGLRAAVCYYGIPPAQSADLSAIRIPVLAHFANHDDWCNSHAVDALERLFHRGRVKYAMHRYEAHHGFFNERRGVYDEEAADQSWERTLQFLRAQLGQPVNRHTVGIAAR